MSGELYACAWATQFPAQALLRLRTDLQTEAVAVLDGRAPDEWVCSMNGLAARKGAAVGMTRLDAESVEGLHLLKRSMESEAAAKEVFRECAAKFSPRIEDASPMAGEGEAGANRMGERNGTACALVLDIAGTERLFGAPLQLAERLREELAAVGFHASVAVSANYDAVRMKAAGIYGIAAISEGAEAEALAELPIAALGMDGDHEETFALWGISTLGDLAALPEAELVSRMGPEARRWHALASGTAEHAFVPIEAEFALEEFCEFETPVEQIDSLLFVCAHMIDCLMTRAAGRALALRSLTAQMGLEGGGTHCVTIRPAAPATDRRFLLKLLQLEIGAHAPSAAVVSFALRAEAGQVSPMQLGLFAPQMPEPARLDVTLARLRAMVGDARAGSPALEDTHRMDGFRVECFAPGDGAEAPMEERPRMALRRLRPARAVRVVLRETKPTTFRDGENAYRIAAAYGPWRTSGCWWELDEWDMEEWDVLAALVEKRPSGAKAPYHFAGGTAQLKLCPFKTFDSPVESGYRNGGTIACLLACNRARNVWRLEAFYD